MNIINQPHWGGGGRYIAVTRHTRTGVGLCTLGNGLPLWCMPYRTVRLGYLDAYSVLNTTYNTGHYTFARYHIMAAGITRPCNIIWPLADKIMCAVGDAGLYENGTVAAYEK